MQRVEVSKYLKTLGQTVIYLVIVQAFFVNPVQAKGDPSLGHLIQCFQRVDQSYIDLARDEEYEERILELKSSIFFHLDRSSIEEFDFVDKSTSDSIKRFEDPKSLVYVDSESERILWMNSSGVWEIPLPNPGILKHKIFGKKLIKRNDQRAVVRTSGIGSLPLYIVYEYLGMDLKNLKIHSIGENEIPQREKLLFGNEPIPVQVVVSNRILLGKENFRRFASLAKKRIEYLRENLRNDLEDRLERYYYSTSSRGDFVDGDGVLKLAENIWNISQSCRGVIHIFKKELRSDFNRLLHGTRIQARQSFQEYHPTAPGYQYPKLLNQPASMGAQSRVQAKSKTKLPEERVEEESEEIKIQQTELSNRSRVEGLNSQGLENVDQKKRVEVLGVSKRTYSTLIELKPMLHRKVLEESFNRSETTQIQFTIRDSKGYRRALRKESFGILDSGKAIGSSSLKYLTPERRLKVFIDSSSKTKNWFERNSIGAFIQKLTPYYSEILICRTTIECQKYKIGSNIRVKGSWEKILTKSINDTEKENHYLFLTSKKLGITENKRRTIEENFQKRNIRILVISEKLGKLTKGWMKLSNETSGMCAKFEELETSTQMIEWKLTELLSLDQHLSLSYDRVRLFDGAPQVELRAKDLWLNLDEERSLSFEIERVVDISSKFESLSWKLSEDIDFENISLLIGGQNISRNHFDLIYLEEGDFELILKFIPTIHSKIEIEYYSRNSSRFKNDFEIEDATQIKEVFVDGKPLLETQYRLLNLDAKTVLRLKWAQILGVEDKDAVEVRVNYLK